MARNLGSLDLSNAEKASTWLLAFSALARAKHWEDVAAVEANPEANEPATVANFVIADNFMACCGLEALEKVQYIVAPRDVNNMSFKDIKTAVQTYLAPKSKIIIAERANFYNTKQAEGESVVDFTTRLRKAVQFCNFEGLKTSADPTEEMVLAALIAGLSKSDQKQRILEQFQTNNTLSVIQVIEQVQQMEQLKHFVQSHQPETSESHNPTINADEIHFQSKGRVIHKCKFCGLSHEIRKCPAYGKKCSFCQKTNHFAAVCKSKAKAAEAQLHAVVNSDDRPADSNQLLFISPDQTHLIDNVQDKMETISINGQAVHMQIDTGASCTVISSKMWRALGTPALSRSGKVLEAYDGHQLRINGKFTALIESKTKFLTANITVVQAEKSFGLLGRDIMDNIVSTDQIHATHTSSSAALPAIKGVTATMDLLEGARNVFCRARTVPIALEVPVKEELTRLEALGIITPIEGGVENASPVVWIKKPDGSLRMCVDFKTHINGKIKTESFPTPSTDTNVKTRGGTFRGISKLFWPTHS